MTVPAGYNGKNPQGLNFFGPAFSEAKLLAFAHVYEQATHRREPPTVINAGLLEAACGGTTKPAASPTVFPANVFDPAWER